MTETITIPAEALKLLKTDGFMKRYYVILMETNTHRAAYSRVEDEYYSAFQERRYANYRTFCVIRRRWLVKYKPNLK
jgi:hypothetical protein